MVFRAPRIHFKLPLDGSSFVNAIEAFRNFDFIVFLFSEINKWVAFSTVVSLI